MGMEGLGCILAGTSHRHRYRYSTTVQIQSKMWTELRHLHSSPRQTLVLQGSCYQTPHCRTHRNRQINNIFLSLQRIKLVFSIAFTVSSKIKISMASSKFREFHQRKKKRLFIKSQLPAVFWDTAHHISSGLTLRTARVTQTPALCCTAGRMSGTHQPRVAVLCFKGSQFWHHRGEGELEKGFGVEGKPKSCWLPQQAGT